VVFTYGWEREDVGIPMGSTTVEITLRPVPEGTELHLVHRGLSAPMADAHDGGWRNYLGRLTAVAEARDPGADPLAAQRVPSARAAGSTPDADASSSRPGQDIPSRQPGDGFAKGSP
jgi:hypothetical protein